MALAPKTVKTYTLNGSLKDFSITFEYLARKFVTVTLIGATRRELVLNIDFRFSTSTQITTLRGSAWGPADNYDLIEIRRFTSATERLVDFADGSILRAYDLNTSQVQSLHIAEEARDLTADTIGVNNDGNLDARARRIVNLADPIDPGDAVTLRMEQQWAGSTLTSKIAAEAARDATFVARDLSLGYRDTSYTYQANALSYANSAIAARDAAISARDLAQLWSSKEENVPVSGGSYSALHWAAKAAAQATLATSNGQAQVALATDQVALATAQKDLAAAQAVIATTKASEAAASAAVVGGVVAVNRSFRNLLINGDFRFWQRRTGWTLSGLGSVYCADRWATFQSSGTNTVSVQNHTYGQTVIPDNPMNYIRHVFSGQGLAAGDYNHLIQAIEGAHVAAGSPNTTLTFWARAASAGQKIAIEFVQSFGTGGSAFVSFGGQALTLNTSWTKYSITVAVPSVAGKTAGGDSWVSARVNFTGGSDVATRCATTAWNTPGTVDLSQFQWEVGTGTPFEVVPWQVAMELCSRYYETMGGTCSPAHGPYVWHQWKVPKYKAPQLVFLSGSAPGTYADQVTTYGFRWGFSASGTSDWVLAFEAEIL